MTWDNQYVHLQMWVFIESACVESLWYFGLCVFNFTLAKAILNSNLRMQFTIDQNWKSLPQTFSVESNGTCKRIDF